MLANTHVTGLSVRQNWADLEPTEGNFDFSYLDGQVQAAADHNKVVLLRIKTQSGKPAWVTQAVRDSGGYFFTFDDDGVSTTIPVFWNPVYLAKKKNMIAALGAHFAANPAVKMVAASFANASSEDWNIPHSPGEIVDWLALGYTPEKMLDAGKQIIDATMAAFPNQYVCLAIAADGGLDESPSSLAAGAVADANVTWPGRLIVQINSLSNHIPIAPASLGAAWNLLWNNQPSVGAQMLDNVYGDDTYRVNDGLPGDPTQILTASIAAAASYGVNYVEIYETDVRNLENVVEFASATLDSAQLLNVSTRMNVKTGDNVLIGGFIITGNSPKRILLRALGPSLATAGISGVLADPVLELHGADESVITTNDNWQDTQQAVIAATGVAPPQPQESAIVITLEPGSYTAIVRGQNNTIGQGLLEMYDLETAADSQISNISTRGYVGVLNKVMIAGFILGKGSGNSSVVIRALGPSLTQLGVAGALADPTLELHNENGAELMTNDNWKSNQMGEIIAAGLPPANNLEAAMVLSLPPGAYTAIVAGKDGGAGLAQVEVYRLHK